MKSKFDFQSKVYKKKVYGMNLDEINKNGYRNVMAV